MSVFGRKSRMYAHRLSWLYTFGPIEDGMFVLHKCDNRKCARPSHLFLGTNLDNMRDMDRKGRRNPVKGESHGMSKVSRDDVIEMRRLHAEKRLSKTQIAMQYRVSVSTACRIIDGKNWKSVV